MHGLGVCIKEIEWYDQIYPLKEEKETHIELLPLQGHILAPKEIKKRQMIHEASTVIVETWWGVCKDSFKVLFIF